MSANDGGPAFPQHLAFNPNGEAVTAGMYFSEGPGMSLRDWFAGMALQGIIAKHPPKNGTVFDDHDEIAFANGAFAYADAMLAARKEAE